MRLEKLAFFQSAQPVPLSLILKRSYFEVVPSAFADYCENYVEYIFAEPPEGAEHVRLGDVEVWFEGDKIYKIKLNNFAKHSGLGDYPPLSVFDVTKGMAKAFEHVKKVLKGLQSQKPTL